MNKFRNIAFCALLCYACTTSNETEKYQPSRNNIIHVRDKVVEIEIEDPLISTNNRLYVMDKYLIIQDMKSLNKLIHLFSRDKFNYIAGIGDRGQGPNELANMGFIAVDEPRRKFYVSDHGKNKVFSYDLDSVLSDSSFVPEVKMLIDENAFPHYYKLIYDSIAICMLIQPIGNNNYKPAAGKINMHPGEITLMPYENPKPEGRKRSIVAVSLEHKIYAEYYLKHDLMTLCNWEGDLIHNIYGPAWKEEFDRVNDYYKRVVFGGDKIYASYLGGKAVDEQRMRGNSAPQILVFDIHGNYLHTLDLGLGIVDICYDKENNRLLLSFNDEIQFGYLPLD